MMTLRMLLRPAIRDYRDGKQAIREVVADIANSFKHQQTLEDLIEITKHRIEEIEHDVS